MADIYTLYAIKINGTGEVIDQITSQNVAPGIELMLVSGDSSLDAKHVSVKAQAPMITFRTTGILKALDAVGVGGRAIAAGESATSVDVYFRKRAMVGGYEAGAVHVKMTVNKGILIPTTLPANHPDEAEIGYALTVLWDGTNDPIVITKNQSLPDLSPDVAKVYTVGPWWVRGTKLIGMRTTEIDFGLAVETKPSDGDVWPTAGHIISREPTLTGQTTDLVVLDDTTGLGIMGKVEAGGTRVFLRRKEFGSGPYADVATEHIRFTMAEGMINPGDFGGDHRGDAVAGLAWAPTFDDTNDPIAYTKEVAVA